MPAFTLAVGSDGGYTTVTMERREWLNRWRWLAIALVLGADVAHAQSDTATVTNTLSPAQVAQREFEWGTVFLRENRFASAAEAFQHAALLLPGYVEAYVQWGVALVQVGNLSPSAVERLQKYKEATDKFGKAVELRPTDKNAYLLWSNALILIGDLPVEPRVRLACYQGAAEKYRKVTELAPQEWGAYSQWGDLLTNKLPPFATDDKSREELYRKAAALFGKAAENARYSADLAPACANWGTALARAARFTADSSEKQLLLREAISKFERAARAIPNSASTYALWGATLLELGKITRLRTDLRDGITQLNASLALKPNDPGTLYTLACGYALMDNSIMAIQTLKQCLAADGANTYRASAPRDPDLASLRGQPNFAELFQTDTRHGIPAYNPPLRDGPR